MNQALRQVSSQIVLEAAYGRFYKTEAQAVKAWKNGADFKIVNGPYCSVRDSVALANECGAVYVKYDTRKYVRVL